MAKSNELVKKGLKAANENKKILGNHTSFISGDLLHFYSELEDRQNCTAEAVRWYLPPLVAILESFYKVLFAKYLDTNATYLSRAEKLHNVYKPELKFDLLFGLNQKQFTIGELYAHSLKYNSLSEIRKNYELICNCDYINQIKNFDVSLLNGADIKEGEKAQKNIENIFSSVAQAFILRHSLIHEYPASNVSVAKEQMLNYLENARLLTMITDRVFTIDVKKM
jgi:hypothetical protein